MSNEEENNSMDLARLLDLCCQEDEQFLADPENYPTIAHRYPGYRTMEALRTPSPVAMECDEYIPPSPAANSNVADLFTAVPEFSQLPPSQTASQIEDSAAVNNLLATQKFEEFLNKMKRPRPVAVPETCSPSCAGCYHCGN